MTARVVARPVAEVPRLEPGAFREHVLGQRARGRRIATLFGRRDGDRVTLTAVVGGPGDDLALARTEVEVAHGLHEMTTTWPALHAFEREIHEQTGMRVAGHPWLKPLRHEGGEQADMARYPYHVVAGKEIHEVAVGPIHAGVIEPGSFRFMCEGELVHHLEIQLGHQHRGIEPRMVGRDPARIAPWIETVAGDTSIGHAWASAAAVEALAGEPATDEVDDARAIALELERVAMHLATLSGMAADIAFAQVAAAYGRLRTLAINTTMRLSGSRFGRGAVRPGRSRLRLDRRDEARATVVALHDQVGAVNEQLLGSRTVGHRLHGTGVLPRSLADDLGVGGVVARASGLPVDGRDRATRGAYLRRPIAPVVAGDGDCWARAVVRIGEIDASLTWLRGALAEVPPRPAAGAPITAVRGGAIAVAVVEGFRGPIVHVVETDDGGRIAHAKLQDPSLHGWMGLAQAVRGNAISDFPICNKSFDLSYCGHDL